MAIDPPEQVREGLVEWAHQAVTDWSTWSARPRRPQRAPRVLKPEAVHLTLCFLGSRPVGEIPALGAVVEALAEGAAELLVGAPLWLPPRRPHALAVEIRDRSGRLNGLQAGLSATLSHVSGWEPERRRFRPHITLVRMRTGSVPALDGERPLLPATPQLRFTPESVVLYRSMPGPGGSTYDPLATCALGPTPA